MKFQVKDPLTGPGVCNNDADTLSEFFMPTSTRFAVAVHMLTALAVGDGAPLRSEDLAYSVNTGPVVIRGLLSRLSDAGLTRSQLGAGGGALLARPADKIRLLDVYEAVEDTELFSLHRTPPCANCLPQLQMRTPLPRRRQNVPCWRGSTAPAARRSAPMRSSNRMAVST